MPHTYKINDEVGGHEFSVEADRYGHNDGYFHFDVLASGNILETVFSIRDTAVATIRRA